jgi:hypothetical protein
MSGEYYLYANGKGLSVRQSSTGPPGIVSLAAAERYGYSVWPPGAQNRHILWAL